MSFLSAFLPFLLSSSLTWPPLFLQQDLAFFPMSGQGQEALGRKALILWALLHQKRGGPGDRAATILPPYLGTDLTLKNISIRAYQASLPLRQEDREKVSSNDGTSPGSVGPGI